MIPIKSVKDLEMMRIAGRILAGIMQELEKRIRADIETADLDRVAGELIQREKVIAAFKGYKGFPANLCVSVNEEIVHGIPGGRRLKEGDIISLDLGINYQGYFSDIAVTLGVGQIKPELENLIEITKQALVIGIEKAQENNRVADISRAIQNYVESNGFSVVRQFVGHGIGRMLHEEPEVPNFIRQQSHPCNLLKQGMVLAIEPMVNMGMWESDIMNNGWTAITRDGLPSAHFEHTVAITRQGPEILTQISR